MSFPKQLATDVRSPADGYLFWPEWMREVFLDGLGWKIDEVFRAAFWTYVALVVVLLVLFLWWRKRWGLRTQLIGWLGMAIAILIIPNFDRLWIKHEFVGACRSLAGIHVLKEVSAEGYLYATDGPALRPVETPNFPEWAPSKYTDFPAAYKLGETSGRFRFIEFPYHKEEYYPGYPGVVIDETIRNFVHAEVRDGELVETVLEKPMARYAYMRSPLAGRGVGYGVGYSEYRIVDLQTKEVIAREISVGGGRGWLLRHTIGLLGASGMSCEEDYVQSPKKVEGLSFPWLLPKENDGALSLQDDLYRRIAITKDLIYDFRSLTLLHYPQDLFEKAISNQQGDAK